MKHEKTPMESEMLTVYARFRVEGMTKTESLAMLFELGYKVTPLVLDAIRTQDKYIFAFNH